MGFRINVVVPEETIPSGDFERLLNDVLAEKGFVTFGFLPRPLIGDNVREAVYEDEEFSQDMRVTYQTGVEVKYTVSLIRKDFLMLPLLILVLL